MKRLYISLFIIATVIALGIFTIYFIASQNQRFLGEIEKVENKAESAEALKKEFSRYQKLLGLLVSDEKLFEMEKTLARILSMSKTDDEEFLAECEELKAMSKDILNAYIPTLERLL